MLGGGGGVANFTRYSIAKNTYSFTIPKGKRLKEKNFCLILLNLTLSFEDA